MRERGKAERKKKEGLVDDTNMKGAGSVIVGPIRSYRQLVFFRSAEAMRDRYADVTRHKLP